ncbi:MAG: DUF3575 domain-containing protein [Ferruginibacter sp.]
MKKVFVFLFAMTATTVSFAQYKGGHSDGPDKMNVIKINPLGLLFGSANVSFERVLNEKSSLQVDVAFGGLSVGGVKYTNLGAGLDYKYYVSNSKSAPEGFYVQPGVGFYSVKVKDPTETVTGSGFTIKGIVGNQWVWNSGFSLDLFGGVNYYAGGKIKGNNGVEYTKFSGALPALGVSLGYAF